MTPTKTTASASEAEKKIHWEDDGELIRGYIDEPRMTLFIIERHPTKPYRGRMTGAVIPDEDERIGGLLQDALITWLQGSAAPGYLREFKARLLSTAQSGHDEQVRALVEALKTTINTLRSLEAALSTIDSDERYRAREEGSSANVYTMQIGQSVSARVKAGRALDEFINQPRVLPSLAPFTSPEQPTAGMERRTSKQNIR